jgi:Lecithin:cholesterol acyltransferase
MPLAVSSKDIGYGESSSTRRIARPTEDYVTLRSKVIENLAVVNYDTNNLVLAPYDWRLSTYNLEERDGYFSRLKTTIEGFKY